MLFLSLHFTGSFERQIKIRYRGLHAGTLVVRAVFKNIKEWVLPKKNTEEM